MSTVFDPQRHLTAADEERLAAEAKRLGLDPGEYIETLIKRALFAEPRSIEPRPNEKGGEG
jgi:hypothetical protein